MDARAELAGLQWIRTYLNDDPRIEIDPNFGALHEVRGRLELGPPTTPASVRTVHLPPFLAELLTEHRERNPDTRFVFTGANGGLHRRSNFRRRAWLPALAGDKDRGWTPLNQEMHFHDLRHTHKTWLVEDGVPRILRLVRLGHKRKDVDDHYSHVTGLMVEQTLAALQRRWEQDGGWTAPTGSVGGCRVAAGARIGGWFCISPPSRAPIGAQREAAHHGAAVGIALCSLRVRARRSTPRRRR